MNKHYSLIISGHYALSNETDHDIMTDYFPGIWCIKSYKTAIKYAKEYLANGDTVSVTDYDEPRYHALANKAIKELGLNQPLFPEVAPLKQEAVTNGKPANLSQLKKYLKVGQAVRSQLITSSGELKADRQTFVKAVQSEAVVLDKNGDNSWLYFNKASDWQFTNEYALQNYLNHEGKYVPTIKIIYV